MPSGKLAQAVILRSRPSVAAELVAFSEERDPVSNCPRSNSKASRKLCAIMLTCVVHEKCVFCRSPFSALVPIKKSLLLFCGTPKNWLSHSSTSVINPISANASRTILISSPWFEDNNPGTFSIHTYLGRISFEMRIISQKRLERFPSSPALFPATDTSWQGNPPHMRSTRADTVDRRTFLTSSAPWVSGQWRRNTDMACLSISHCKTQFIPARSNPKSNPPIPVNKDTKFKNHPLKVHS
jgi:hypothetical protein